MKISHTLTFFLTLLYLITALIPLNAKADDRSDYVAKAKTYLNQNGVSSKTLKNQKQQNWQAQNKQKTTTVTDDERTVTPGKQTTRNKGKKAQKRQRARQRTREAKSQGVND